MKNFYSVIIFTFLLFTSTLTYGQLKLSGEIRPRSEFQNGYKSLHDIDVKATSFISQRTRLNVNYKKESMIFKVAFQDVRTWGDTPQLNYSDYFLALHEAWGEVKFTKNVSLKVGRQELVYDDHRIFGSVGWAQQARSHDLGLFKYEDEFKVHIGAAYNQPKKGEIPKNIGAFYQSMQFAWFNKSAENINFSLLFLNNGLQAFSEKQMINETRYSQTIGTFVKSKISVVTIDGSFYYQTGKDRGNKSLSAYDFAINTKIGLTDIFYVKAGVELLSGTDYNSTKNNSFTPFYGTNHKFNGFMDYFYVGNHGGNVGLNDFNLGVGFKEGKWKAGATAHYFMTNADMLDNNAKVANPYLGTELDLSVGYKFSNSVSFSGGYSQMFATNTMELLKNRNKDATNNWAYFMITLKPKFLDTTPKTESN
ncbi:MAG: hypothetical protein KAG96_08110 [Ichthyobacteriaceae bacterium]|nr:hypothetical protein [Ichthyobacteriaceae bacterium]